MGIGNGRQGNPNSELDLVEDVMTIKPTTSQLPDATKYSSQPTFEGVNFYDLKNTEAHITSTEARTSTMLVKKENKPRKKRTRHSTEYHSKQELEMARKLQQFELYLTNQAANCTSTALQHSLAGKEASKDINKALAFQDTLDYLHFHRNLIDLKNKVYEDLRLIQVGLSQDYSYMLEAFQEFWDTRNAVLHEAIAKADKLAEILDKANSVDASKRNVLIDHLKASFTTSRWIKKCVTVGEVANVKESLSNYLRLDYGEVSRLETFVHTFLQNPQKFTHVSPPRPACDPFLVTVTRVVDPGEFYVVRWCDKEILGRISRTLEKEALSYHKPSEVILGQMYAVFAKGSKWHRGICRQPCGEAEVNDSPEKLYLFNLVDEGSEETVPSFLVRLLPKELEVIPKLAIQCTLNQSFKRSLYSTVDTSRFKKAVQRSPMSMKIFNQQGGILNVDLAQLPSFEESDYYISLRDALFLSHGNPRALETPPIRKFKPKYDVMNLNRAKFHNLRAYISWAHNPANVYVNILDEDWPLFAQMYQDMQDELAHATRDPPETISKEHVCAVKQDGIWHRALVEENVFRSRVRVFLVDSGHRLVISTDQCYHLPDKFMELPAQSVRCVLDGLKPMPNDRAHPASQRPKWSQAALDHVHLANNRRAVLGVQSLFGYQVGKLNLSNELTAYSIVHVDDQEISLNQLLCSLKLATTNKRTVLLDVGKARKDLAAFDEIFESFPIDDGLDLQSWVPQKTEESVLTEAVENDGNFTKSIEAFMLEERAPDFSSPSNEMPSSTYKPASDLSPGNVESNSCIEIQKESPQNASELKSTVEIQEDSTPLSKEPKPSAVSSDSLIPPQELSSSCDKPGELRSQSLDTQVLTSGPAITRTEISFCGTTFSLKPPTYSVSSDYLGQKTAAKPKCHRNKCASSSKLGGTNIVMFPAGMPVSRRESLGSSKQNQWQYRRQRTGKSERISILETEEDTVSMLNAGSIDSTSALVKFLWCQSPNAIYFRTEEMSRTWSALMSKMQEYYKHNKLDSTSNLECGCMCAVFYEDQWQRARIMEYKQNHHVARIVLWDTGFEREVKSSDIRPIDPQFEEITKLFLCVSLDGVQPAKVAWDSMLNLVITEQLAGAEVIKIFSKCEESSIDQPLIGIVRYTRHIWSDPPCTAIDGPAEMSLTDELIRLQYASLQPFVPRLVFPPKHSCWMNPDYPNVGDRLLVKAAGISKNGYIFIREVRIEEKIFEISHLLAQEYEGTTPEQVDLNAKPGDLCVAKFSEDNEWYRCIVHQLYPKEERVVVKSVDLGSITSVNLTNIRLNIVLHDLHTLSMSCKLHNTKLVGGRAWNDKAIKKVRERVIDKIFNCNVIANDTELHVSLERDDKLLAKELAEQGLMEFVETPLKSTKQP